MNTDGITTAGTGAAKYRYAATIKHNDAGAGADESSGGCASVPVLALVQSGGGHHTRHISVPGIDGIFLYNV